MANTDLIILKNSSYAKGRKYIVDAEQLNENFRRILDSVGTASFQEIIEATGQTYNPLSSTQLINAITQLILAANYFKDIGTVNTIILSPYTDGYGTPTQYIHNMSVKFRPSTTNTGSVTISFNGLTAVPLLTDTQQSLTSGMLIPTSDYSAVYDSEVGAFILSSSIEDSGSLALQEIRHLVESAGLVFSQALEYQLVQAVAQYSVQSTYNCVSNETNIRINNYVLEPFDTFQQIPEYKNGMVFRFRPNFNNTLTNPTVQISGMVRYPLVSSDGDTIPVGSISTEFDVVVKYYNNSFYLVSNGLSSLKLQSGPVVTSISNDTSLTNASGSSVPTEFAVKSYVDAKVNSSKNFSIASGVADSNGRAAFFKKDGDTVLTILAGETGSPSYDTLVSLDNAVASPNKPPYYDEEEEEQYTYDLANCFDGDNDTYYETLDVGSDVAGVKDAEHEGEYLVMPNYIGATGITVSISKFRILGNSSITLPRNVFFQYKGVGSSEWQDVGTEIYEYADASGVIHQKVKRDIYPLEYNTGEYSNIDVIIIPYVDNTNPDMGIYEEYDVRCYAYTFDNDTDGWQVVSYEFCVESDEIAPLVLTYANGTSEVLTDKYQVSTSSLTGDSAIIIKTYGGTFEALDSSMYIESFSAPTPVAGLHWVDLTGGKPTPMLYEEDEDDETIINLVPANYVKLGSVELSNGEIMVLHPSAFNGQYIDANITLSNPTTISHNIGSLNTAKMFITCITSEGGYIPGDTVELTTQALSVDVSNLSVETTVDGTNITIAPVNIGGVDYNITHSPNPHTHTATSTISGTVGTPAYRVVSSGYTSAILRYNTIMLPNKNNGSLFSINPSLWKLSINCTRSF